MMRGLLISGNCDKIHQLKDIRQLTQVMACDNFIAATNLFSEK